MRIMLVYTDVTREREPYTTIQPTSVASLFSASIRDIEGTNHLLYNLKILQL